MASLVRVKCWTTTADGSSVITVHHCKMPHFLSILTSFVFPSWTPVETSCIINDRKKSTALWETPYGALCLQPPMKRLSFLHQGKMFLSYETQDGRIFSAGSAGWDRKSSRFSASLRNWCFHPGGSAAAAHYNVTTAASSSGDNAEGHSTDGIFPLALPRLISNIKVAIDSPGIDGGARLRRAADERAKWSVKSETTRRRTWGRRQRQHHWCRLNTNHHRDTASINMRRGEQHQQKSHFDVLHCGSTRCLG